MTGKIVAIARTASSLGRAIHEACGRNGSRTVVLGFAGVAQAQQAGKLFFEGDIVRGAQPGAPGPFCVLTSQFKRLEKVVWRIRVLDQAGTVARRQGPQEPGRAASRRPEAAEPLGPASAAPARDRPTDHFWTAAWIVPGQLSERHVRLQGCRRRTCKGQTHTWEPFKSKTSQFTVVAGAIEIKSKPEPRVTTMP